MKTIIFDLDDTLIDTGKYYVEKIMILARILKQVFNDENLTTEKIWQIQEDIDIKEIYKKGFEKSRFPTSFIKTYRYFCEQKNIEPDQELERKLKYIGASVYNDIPELLSGAGEVLEYLKKRQKELILYTLGEQEIQMEKIKFHNFDKIFDKIAIVKQKDEKILEELLDGRGREETAIIGDSLKGEIAPAVKIGLKAFYFERESPWKYLIDVKIDCEYIKIKSLKELFNYL